MTLSDVLGNTATLLARLRHPTLGISTRHEGQWLLAGTERRLARQRDGRIHEHSWRTGKGGASPTAYMKDMELTDPCGEGSGRAGEPHCTAINYESINSAAVRVVRRAGREPLVAGRGATPSYPSRFLSGLPTLSPVILDII